MDELNRDLLVAVLAVLTDAAPRPGLAAALEAWSHESRAATGSVAQDSRPALDDELFQALESLAAAHLEDASRRSSPEPDAAERSGAH